MGYLKDMLGAAMAEAREPKEEGTDAFLMFLDYKHRFKAMIGKPLLWKTSNNPNVKSPQLVWVETPFMYFVVVVKTVYNVKAQPSTLRYSISYSSLHCGHDSFETLEIPL